MVNNQTAKKLVKPPKVMPLTKNTNSSSKIKTNDQDDLVEVRGILDTYKDGHGVIRVGYREDDQDAYIATSQIKRLNLRPGDEVVGLARRPKDNERYLGLLK